MEVLARSLVLGTVPNFKSDLGTVQATPVVGLRQKSLSP